MTANDSCDSIAGVIFLSNSGHLTVKFLENPSI